MSKATDSGSPQAVRLDKWLQVARAFRTRSKATKACQAGKVRVDGATAKPHHPVAVDQRVEIDMGQGWTRVLVVRKIADKPVPKGVAPTLYEDLSPPRPRVEPMGEIFRPRGSGRPTGRERRVMERFRRRR